MSFSYSTCAVFIDRNIFDYNHLINGTKQAVSTLTIPANQDGIIYITKNLDKSVKTLHLVSHGSPGCLYVGNTQLNVDNINKYADYLQQWQLDTILIYGCQVAAGDAGSEFVEKLHKITGATILASKSLTGNKDYGGNWDLEVTKGDTEAEIIFTPEVIESYAGVLQETIVVNTAEDQNDGINVGGVSLREAILRANSVPGRDRIEFAPSLANSTITLSIGETLQIVEDLTITGENAENLTINGNITQPLDETETRIVIFNLDDGLAEVQSEVSIDNLTISDGITGITSVENLILEDSIISDNTNSNIILNNSTSSNIKNSVIQNNTGSDSAGGLSVTNTILTIENSRIENNNGRNGSGLNASNSSLIISNSTISGNSSGRGIGGLNVGGSTLTISDSTMSDNSGRGLSADRSTLTISDSTISDNSGNGLSANYSSLTISDSTISDNSGNGLSGLRSILTISDSTISRNSSNSNGGGLLANGGSLTISKSTISENSSTGDGGGLSVVTGSLTINDSTISENSSNSNGGGLSIGSNSSVINNTTISGNSAANSGGGINSINTTSYITNSTITNNEALDTQGSGIASGGTGLSLIANTIIAGNVNSDIDFNGDVNTFRSSGGNMVGLGNAARVFTETNDITAVEDPQLGDLGDNGGPTQTHLPQSESPAIDGGVNNAIPDDVTTDQRGSVRISNNIVDIGAVEIAGPINGTNQSERLSGGDANDTINGLGGDDSIFGNGGEDLINGGFNDDQLFGGTENDILIGGGGDDSLDGGTGNDTMRGSDGDDTYLVDSVNDVVENEKPNAAGGIDTIISSVDWALGPQGRNVENLTVDNDRFVAGIGNVLDNQITGTNSRNRLSGGSGNDTIDGGRQDDRLLGNGGNDILIGNFGEDLLEGGEGRDRFQYDSIRHGGDTIVDFNPAADFITLSSSGFGGGLDTGTLNEEQFLIVEDIENIDSNFDLGVVYATNDGTLAYLDGSDLTNIATLEGIPSIEFSNLQIF